MDKEIEEEFMEVYTMIEALGKLQLRMIATLKKLKEK